MQIDHETIVWANAERREMVADVLGKVRGLCVLAVGGPRKAPLKDLAGSFGLTPVDDLRKMLVDHPASFLFLATNQTVTSGDLDQARRSQMEVLAVEPPFSEDDVSETDRGRDEAVARLTIVPWMRMAPAWQSAADPQEALGRVQAAHLCSVCSPGGGSLYGRLYDQMDMIVQLMGMPDTIDASLTGSLTEPPDNLRRLTGHMTAHLRFGNTGSAVLLASDQGSGWLRRMVVHGTDGQLILSDDHYRLFGPAGKVLDALEAPPPADPAEPVRAADLIAAQWQRIIDHRHTPAPVDAKAVVTCCQTALLSCRTGNSESPSTLLRMHGV